MAYATLPRYEERDIPTAEESSAADYEAADPATIDAMVANINLRNQQAASSPVVIGQERWKELVPGPVPTGGRPISLTGGTPFKPQGMPWWMVQQDLEAKQQAERDRIQEMIQSVPVMQREKALESAMRLEGNLAYQADLQAGVDPQQALLKNAPKLFYNSQNALASVLRYGSRPAQAPFTFGESFPVEGGTLVRTGPGSSVLVRKKEPLTERPASITARVSALKDYMQTLDEEEALIPKTDPRREQIAKDRAAILPQYQALIKQIATGQAPSAAPSAATSSNKEESRRRAKEYISKYPSKADAIRKRFRDTFNEDV